MKKIMALLLVTMLSVFVLAGCGQNDSGNGADVGSEDTGKVYNLRVAAQESEEHNDVKSLRRAAEAIAEKTDGHVNLTIYPANQLGDYSQVYDEVIAGTIDMACITIPTTYDSRLEMLTIPYLTTNYEEAIDTFLPGSEFFEHLDKIQLEKGVKTLTAYLDGFMGIGATKSIKNAFCKFNPIAPAWVSVQPRASKMPWTTMIPITVF